jgi:hypothetical protein
MCALCFVLPVHVWQKRANDIYGGCFDDRRVQKPTQTYPWLQRVEQRVSIDRLA